MTGIHDLMDKLLPFEIFSFGFMKNALLALLLLTPLLALFGTMAVNRRMAFFSDALGHSALAGAGIGMLLGFSNLTITLVLFGLFWALLINRIKEFRTHRYRTCPNCHTSWRLKKKIGTMTITCPKCHTTSQVTIKR